METGTAYSYIRFSSHIQERGDSIRRQTELRDRWLARHPGIVLDESLTLTALGVSAFRGKHRADDRTALGQFLHAVKDGKVKLGSYLLVESLDRLTREELGDAFELVLGLVNRRIRIVQLSPVETILQKPVDMAGLMLAVVELSRGNSESRMKSVRIGAAWAKKREEARKTKRVLTPRGPAWLEYHDGRFDFKPGAKALIWRIYRMSANGVGCRLIARTLTAEAVAGWTRAGWTSGNVRNLIRSRATVGEIQLRKCEADGSRRPDGDVLEDYYPRAISEAVWHAANAATDGRRRRGGGQRREGHFVNIWVGLLRDASAGTALHVNHWGSRSGGKLRTRVYISSKFLKRGAIASDLGKMPVEVFDRLVLSRLKEIDPRELFPDESPDDLEEMRAQLSRLDAQIRTMADQYDGDDVPEVAEKVKKKNVERKKLVADIARAEQESRSPRTGTFAEFRTLADALASAKDIRAARMRLRSLIARTVERVDVLFVSAKAKPRNGDGYRRTEETVAAVQIRFVGGAVRDYAIFHRPRRVGHGYSRSEESCVKSFVAASIVPCDLRDPVAVAKLELALRAALEEYREAHAREPGSFSYKRRGVVDLLTTNANWSNRRIAKSTDTYHRFVSRVRKELVAAGVIGQVDAVVGRDGKKRRVCRSGAR